MSLNFNQPANLQVLCVCSC